MDLHQPKPLDVVAYLDDVFSYHAPTPDQLPRYEALRGAAKAFARTIVENTPKCADQAAAIRKVREAVMTANAAVALKGAVVLLVALLLGAAPAAADSATEPGVRVSAIGSAEIVLAAGADRAVRPAADVVVDGPLAFGSDAPARIYTRLRLLGLPGDTVALGSVETFRAAEISLGLYKRVGRLHLGEQEVWTSLEAEWGFASALPRPDTEGPEKRHVRHYGGGIRLEERQSGAWLSVLYGRHESAGPRAFGQWLVSGAVPLGLTKRAVVLGGDAIVSAGPDAAGLQRDQVRIYVGLDLPQLVEAFR